MFLFGNMETIELLHELPASITAGAGTAVIFILLCIQANVDQNSWWSVYGPTVPSQAEAEWPRPGDQEQSPQERRDSEVRAEGRGPT